MSAIAITGMACRYAEARSPRQLWENVLAQRQSFRRIPAVRLRVEDYSSDQNDESISVQMAAVLDDYDFDRVRFHVSRETFLSTDMVHWLALDMAAHALEDARLLDASAAQRERVGVYIGNSLTGEFSRANLLRLRWPYVRRVLASTLNESNSGCSRAQVETLLEEIEARYKAPFPATTEDSLAGGLANTIAGRICNYFDFKGGGYTVDGACASSLLAVTTACAALESGDVDIAIAGGVDLSLDPFELAGFSKLGALAPDKMRVFDEHSAGFLPGEGCGMVVLMRHEDAVAGQHPPYAVIRGWGVSSDGRGGITRPEASGQKLALKRAYERAHYGMDSVAYFEGHGTGTSVGDAAELQALSMARRETGTQAAPAALGSVKANIGHTKAAAGVAGLIKATMAVQARILPPTTGCDSPHAELAGVKPMLRVLKEGELWPHGDCARAGVSAMGFGGINTHVTLEAADHFHRRNFTGTERQQLSSAQDCEVFFFQAASTAALAEQLSQALIHTSYISYAEMTDMAASLAAQAAEAGGPVRAACVAATPGQLQQNIQQLHEWCTTGVQRQIDSTRGIFLGSGSAPARIGFLFPGQGSPVYTNGGMWARRFSAVRELYAGLSLAQSPVAQTTATETAQPCVVAASLAGLMMLEGCGVKASIALGHSLGELTALCWAGACASEDLLRLVAERGRVMAQKAAASGAMASIRADAHEVKRRLNGDRLVIAAYNSPRQTVVSGDAQALDRFLARLSSSGIHSTRLPVSHAFHSPLVEDVADAFSGYLAGENFAGLRQRVVSTVTGAVLENDADLRELLAAQITSPVRFADAVALASAETDLFLEVGPGTVLSGIAAEVTDKPAISLNAGSESLRGLLMAVGAAFALGSSIKPSALFEGRFYRSFQPQHTFLANPCESAVVSESPQRSRALPSEERMDTAAIETVGSAIETLRHLVARRTELPLAAIQPEKRFLDDLHLNSITVSQMILEAAAQLGVSAPAMPNEYANASLSEAAASLETLRLAAPAPTKEKHPQGLEPWVRLLEVRLVEQSLRPTPHRAGSLGESQWEIFAMHESDLRDTLAQQLKNVPGRGLVCLVPAARDEDSAAFLLDIAQMAVKRHVEQVIFVQHGVGSAAALARTLHLENPEMKVRVISTPTEQAGVGRWIMAEALSQSPFTEAHYDAAGIRREPRVKAIWAGERQEQIALNNRDLLLVTGGGKGIAAECALELARESGCTLALLGRSDAERDPELKQNLLRLAQSGIRFRYYAADIADKEALEMVILRIEQELGSITAVLHGAGVNHPQRLPEITRADLHDTLSPKLTGLENLLRQINAAHLRLLITFGSIIGRAGLQGEGHYALANEWLGRLVEEWQASHPQCRCLNLEWSVWAGAGMGQKLGVLDALMRQGITPLPLDGAIATLKDMLAWKQSPVSTMITGRFGQLPTLQFEHSELPLRRFLEHVQVYYPGIELVADAELSADTDPYVAEHAFHGEQLFPAVCGIEAMAQAAMALQQTDQAPQLRNLRFEQPIVVPRNQTVKIRIAALQRGPETVSVVVRCSSTAYQTDHFSAECSFNHAAGTLPILDAENPAQAGCGPEAALNIARDIYEGLLFHQGRFRRIERYRTLRATRSVAEISAPWQGAWFARHLPQDFVMGDAASRDAAIHSIQASIPYKTVLPVGVESITASACWTHAAATVEAVERLRDGDNFMYDVEIRDAQGSVCESWKGLHLRAVSPIARTAPWPPALLAAYLERKLNELLSVPAMVMIGIGEEDTRDKRNAPIIAKMFGPNAMLVHRSDGKPEIAGTRTGDGKHVSLSHCGPLTLLASSSRALGCDTEQIASRDFSSWEKLLGSEGIALAQQVAEKYVLPLDHAATQVWTLKESLRKAGAGFETSLRVDGSAGSWMIFRSGPWAAASFHGEVEGFDSELAFGFVVATKP
jgi:enediyne polyketide synthase